jgi:hypothetical protein
MYHAGTYYFVHMVTQNQPAPTVCIGPYKLASHSDRYMCVTNAWLGLHFLTRARKLRLFPALPLDGEALLNSTTQISNVDSISNLLIRINYHENFPVFA